MAVHISQLGRVPPDRRLTRGCCCRELCVQLHATSFPVRAINTAMQWRKPSQSTDVLDIASLSLSSPIYKAKIPRSVAAWNLLGT